MNVPSYIKTHKPELIAFMKQAIQDQNSECYHYLKFYSGSLDQLAQFATKGKLIRGLLIPMIYEFLKKEPGPKELYYAAAALEMAHAALLVHDDVIDNDMQRRGEKSIFAQYAEGKSIEYGKNLAICVGDVAIFLSYKFLSLASEKTDNCHRLIGIFSHELHLVGVGEMIDVDMATAEDEDSVENIIEMYRYKTARYTFSLPFKIGAIFAGASEETIRTLDLLGEQLGILFQIKDDELGLTGKEEETGKPVGSDIKENKKTIVRALLFQSVTAAEKQELLEIYGNKDADKVQIQRVLELYEQYRIADRVIEIQDNVIQRFDTHVAELERQVGDVSLMRQLRELLEQRKN
jgi:geranylgeranyl diphosphate synthase type I